MVLVNSVHLHVCNPVTSIIYTINVDLSVCVLHIYSYTSRWIWTKFVTEVKGCTGQVKAGLAAPSALKCIPPGK